MCWVLTFMFWVITFIFWVITLMFWDITLMLLTSPSPHLIPSRPHRGFNKGSTQCEDQFKAYTESAVAQSLKPTPKPLNKKLAPLEKTIAFSYL